MSDDDQDLSVVLGDDGNPQVVDPNGIPQTTLYSGPNGVPIQSPGESDSDFAARITAWDASDKRTAQSNVATQTAQYNLGRQLVESGDLDVANGTPSTVQLTNQNLAQTGSATGTPPSTVATTLAGAGNAIASAASAASAALPGLPSLPSLAIGGGVLAVVGIVILVLYLRKK